MANLKRSLNLIQCTLIGVGVMLGAGIYALVGEAAASAGNMVWLAFLLASIVASCTGLSYAELSSFIPRAGGQYYYARRAFGELIAFLTSWMLVIGIAIASAAVAIGFAGYLAGISGLQPVVGACAIIVAAACLLVYGIEQSAWVAVFCTILELLGLAIIVAIGIPHLGTVNYFEPGPMGYSGVVAAGALIFFAYIGFEEIVQLSEETEDPTRNIPKAVLLSIGATTSLYVLVAVCAVSVVGWKELGASESPLADVAAVALGQRAFQGLSVIALFSTANTVLILMMSAARLLFGMAQDKKVPEVLASIHKTRKSPYVSTIAVAVLAILIVVILQDLSVVANLTNFSLLVAFVIINIAVIVLRFRESDTERPFRIPVSIGKVPLIPVFGIASSLYMIAYVGAKTILIGLGLSVVGLGFFLIQRRRYAQQFESEEASNKIN